MSRQQANLSTQIPPQPPPQQEERKTINFFEAELMRMQQLFNQTFGRQTVVNLKARTAAIWAVIHLGLLAQTIDRAADPNQVRAEIDQFVQSRDRLVSFFAMAREQFQRRNHVRRNHRDMSELPQRLPDRAFEAGR